MNKTNAQEVEYFESIADQWWDKNGASKPLHKLNPTRIDYIKRQICDHFETETIEGLSVLDIGCGGGLACEPLAQAGAKVTGIDAGVKAIDVAKAHAEDSGLDITYLNETADTHQGQYDVVLALEIIEHVDDLNAFVESACQKVKDGGIIIFSTLNRTPKSFVLGKVAAEYILRWLPMGTHDWHKFVKPSELAKTLEANAMTVTTIDGVVYNPLLDLFSVSKADITVNYFLCASHKK